MCNAAASNSHSGACLTCLCIKSLSADRLQEKKLSQRLWLKKKKYSSGSAWRLVGEVVFEEEEEEGRNTKKNPNSSRRLARKCAKRCKKLHLQFYQFQTDSRQSPSGYVPACPARARRMAREAVITDPRVTARAANGVRGVVYSGQSECAMSAGKKKSSLLLFLLSRLLTVHWIKQQSELSSSLHWDVGHWLQFIHSGNIREAFVTDWYYCLRHVHTSHN